MLALLVMIVLAPPLSSCQELAGQSAKSRENSCALFHRLFELDLGLGPGIYAISNQSV